MLNVWRRHCQTFEPLLYIVLAVCITSMASRFLTFRCRWLSQVQMKSYIQLLLIYVNARSYLAKSPKWHSLQASLCHSSKIICRLREALTCNCVTSGQCFFLSSKRPPEWWILSTETIELICNLDLEVIHAISSKQTERLSSWLFYCFSVKLRVAGIELKKKMLKITDIQGNMDGGYLHYQSLLILYTCYNLDLLLLS